MLRACIIFLAIVSALHGAGYKGKARPVIPNIQLRDGRTLTEAQILSETGDTVNVRHGQQVERISKALLPDELLAEWPINAAKAAQEKAAEETRLRLAREKKERIAQNLKKENDREAAEARRHNAKIEGERIAREKAELSKAARRRELQARSRDDLLLVGFGLYPSLGALTVNISNVGENPESLDWRQLRALANDGTVVPAGDVRFEGKEVASYNISTDKTRTFTVIFKRSDLVAIGWADRPELGWVDYGGQNVSAQAAIEQARERAIAAARARNAKGTKPIEGQALQR